MRHIWEGVKLTKDQFDGGRAVIPHMWGANGSLIACIVLPAVLGQFQHATPEHGGKILLTNSVSMLKRTPAHRPMGREQNQNGS